MHSYHTQTLSQNIQRAVASTGVVITFGVPLSYHNRQEDKDAIARYTQHKLKVSKTPEEKKNALREDAKQKFEKIYMPQWYDVFTIGGSIVLGCLFANTYFSSNKRSITRIRHTLDQHVFHPLATFCSKHRGKKNRDNRSPTL